MLAIPASYQNFVSGPLIIQLAGNTPETIVEATKVLLSSTNKNTITGIDLNLGCPQQIAKKGCYGAFLAESNFDTVCDILQALSNYIRLESKSPTTVISAKIRLPIDDETLTQIRIPKLLETGISFLTIHGRTIHENKQHAGPCHISRIRLAIETAHNIIPNFPIIANGGIESYCDAVRLQQETNATATMSSEALLETPNVFCSNFDTCSGGGDDDDDKERRWTNRLSHAWN